MGSRGGRAVLHQQHDRAGGNRAEEDPRRLWHRRGRLHAGMYVSARAAASLFSFVRMLIRALATAAAFLEFHAPHAAWLHPQGRGPTGEDTLLTSGEVYNNYARMSVWYKSPGTA